ncbi:hypothetical protein [Paragemmobacter straminiformis]|uniref:Uncharacterized protein n=1 Tax=Paragemmobacter straminiformis TaxID=2045119 RepID=A0A842IDP3_9RHOB|nr:hypothetical protein [Gemmobacter straminiformis]MBC2837629.1 hypothetical protein [Gemmobacter straminiformis]
MASKEKDGKTPTFTRAANDVGHYFDQVTEDREMLRLQMRAAQLAMSEELERLGVKIDPHTGKVSVDPARKDN